jgi:2-dehydro-3-deoxygalactonokinase
MTTQNNVSLALVAVDWGTSSLRVWGLSSAGSVLAERRSDEGMARLQPSEFEPALRRHIAALGLTPGGLEPGRTPLPVVVCGMAGARQGWREARYIDVPTGLGTLCGGALAVPAAGLDVRILPGLADRQAGGDVMRGEETQLLGLLQAEPDFSGVVCLPGTHSKWVWLEGGQVLGFSTFMTGEIFAVLGQHSVLRHSLDGAGPSGDPESTAFLRGVASGLAEPERLMAALFGVRAATMLHGVAGTPAADMLSGLLIGAEITGSGTAPGAPVTLLAGDHLATSYRRALALAGHPVQVMDSGVAVRHGLALAAQQLWQGCIA